MLRELEFSAILNIRNSQQFRLFMNYVTQEGQMHFFVTFVLETHSEYQLFENVNII